MKPAKWTDITAAAYATFALDAGTFYETAAATADTAEHNARCLAGTADATASADAAAYFRAYAYAAMDSAEAAKAAAEEATVYLSQNESVINT